jgi:ABC-2 type transport system ATP-binding protein
MEVIAEIQGLYKSFPPSSQSSLTDITAMIPQGKMVGLVGPDGAGKTTLIRLMGALLRPTLGSIKIEGKDTVKDSEEIHSLTGYMPQKFGLYDELTVLQNLNLYFDLQGVEKDSKEKLFAKLFHFTRLEPFKDRLARDLSGGMKQKLGLACALIKKPKLLLLDEPSVGVDPVSRRELWKMVHDLMNEGISVMWSTAYLDEAEKCDIILLMNEGKLLFFGEPKDLLSRVSHRSLLSKQIPEGRRALLKQITAEKQVLDAVIQGKEIRVVLDKGIDAASWMRDQKSGALFENTPPRLEDAFIDILGGIPKHESEFARLRPPSEFLSTFTQPLIEIENLTKKFKEFTAVDSISCQIKKGEVFGLLGPNGAGKSTTFKMLCGLLTPTSGKATVLGVDLRKSPADVRQHIGYMAQKFSLYGNMSVLQNLEFFAGIYDMQGKEKKKAIDEMIEIFFLKPYLSTSADLLPLGFKQRLSLACATIHSPDILFLDEPTSGVDPLMRREFWNHINTLVQQGVTVMITTHFMDEAEYCDRIALIYQGKMIHIDSPDNLKKGNETLEEAFIRLIEEYDHV